MERKIVRDQDTRTIIKVMKGWLEEELGRIPPRSVMAEATRYALSRWQTLCRFLDDERIDLDNNPFERAIRPIALGRKNHLFASSNGSGERWATVCSLITTAKLNDVESHGYLKDILERMSQRPSHEPTRSTSPLELDVQKRRQSLIRCKDQALTSLLTSANSDLPGLLFDFVAPYCSPVNAFVLNADAILRHPPWVGFPIPPIWSAAKPSPLI